MVIPLKFIPCKAFLYKKYWYINKKNSIIILHRNYRRFSGRQERVMKLNYKRTILIGLAFLSISAFWQMYDNVVPLILKNTFGLGETITGVVMAADNVLALFLLPVFGTLSDKVDTRIGKRMPFILGGTTLAVILLMVLGYANAARNVILFVSHIILCTMRRAV